MSIRQTRVVPLNTIPYVASSVVSTVRDVRSLTVRLAVKGGLTALMHVLGPELPDGAAQMAIWLSVGISTLHTAVSLAVKPVQVTWLLAVFSTSSSVLSVPHGEASRLEHSY